jgi:ubiquinone biosynthesis protein UbiJ
MFEHMFNEWIDLDAATRQGLNQLAGKTLRVVIDSPQLSVDLLFDVGRVRLNPTPVGMDEQPAHSLFEQRPYERQHAVSAANTTLQVPHVVALVQLLFATPGATGNLSIQGEMAVLQQVQKVIAQAEPDVTAKLAPWIGDSVAHQLGQQLNQAKQALSQTSQRLLEHAEQQLKQDNRLLAPRWQAERFIEGVRDLRNDIERVQARIRQLPVQSDPDSANTAAAIPPAH